MVLWQGQKARWAAEGGKCTNYFCNLEKRHFNEKNNNKNHRRKWRRD
jgi:hypothetical protein